MMSDYKDFVLEPDQRGWRKSFDDLYGALEILNEFQVTYRIKFSGHRCFSTAKRPSFADQKC